MNEIEKIKERYGALMPQEMRTLFAHISKLAAGGGVGREEPQPD